jgi:hypothetical protein
MNKFQFKDTDEDTNEDTVEDIVDIDIVDIDIVDIVENSEKTTVFNKIINSFKSLLNLH